jgi:hypothetical protein
MRHCLKAIAGECVGKQSTTDFQHANNKKGDPAKAGKPLPLSPEAAVPEV